MKIFLATLIILAAWGSVVAQAPDKSAASAFDQLPRNCGEDAMAVVESERKRLGARFEAELLAYLGEDVDKHVRIANCLSGCGQLNDRTLETSSLLIRLQALSLLGGEGDEDSAYTAVTLHVLSAVQSERLGFHGLAITHKAQAESLISGRPILEGGYPAMTADNWQLYKSLPKRQTVSKKTGARVPSGRRRM